jgi:hypothetical protein
MAETPYSHVVVWTAGNRKVGIVCPDFSTAEILRDVMPDVELVMLLDRSESEALMRAAAAAAQHQLEADRAKQKMLTAQVALGEQADRIRSAGILGKMEGEG